MMNDLCCKVAGERHRFKFAADADRILVNLIRRELLKAEKQVLRLFELPTIQQIELFDKGLIEARPGSVAINDARKQRLHDIVSDFQFAIIGDPIVQKDIPQKGGKFGEKMFGVFSKYIAFVFGNLKKIFPGNKSTFNKTRYDPTYNDDIFQEILGQGVNRIKGAIYTDNMDGVVKSIIKGVMVDYLPPLEIASNLHKLYGGALWQWEMRVSSEITLVMNKSFRIQARQSGVQYEVWSAAANACDICAALDGKKWKIGQGPEPVSSTHPRCACMKSGEFFLGKDPLQDRWTRRPPYGSGNGWTAEEIINLPNMFNP